MVLDEKILKHFEELIVLGEAVLNTSRPVQNMGRYVNGQLAEQWGVSTLSFIGRVLGTSSEHYKRFSFFLNDLSQTDTARKAFAVLAAAITDYKGGYLFDARNAIRAEVFDDFIEQADSFLQQGFFQAAAVIAGTVLEDALRQLCTRLSLALPPQPTMDAMNMELAKAGVYDRLLQKKITWLADIRTKAAQGGWYEFKQDDSAEMVKAVRRFVEDYS
jgi:hypothetical protein